MCLHKQHQKHYFICKPQYQIFDILIGSLSNWSAQVDSFYSGGGGDTLLTVTDWRIKKKKSFYYVNLNWIHKTISTILRGMCVVLFFFMSVHVSNRHISVLLNVTC